MAGCADQPNAPVGTSLSIPHLQIPFRIGQDGSALVFQQDTLDEVAQCVGVLVATVVGARKEVPAYGIPDPTFTRGDQGAIHNAVALFEPRAKILSIDDQLSDNGTLQMSVAVAVSNA